MTFTQMLTIIRNRCNNNPLLTKSYVESLARNVMLDIGVKINAFKEYEDLDTVSTQRIYELTSDNAFSISEAYIGTDEDISINKGKLLIPGVDYSVTWRNKSTSVNAAVIELNVLPDGGETLRVFYNDIQGNAATLDMDDGGIVAKNLQFNPLFELSLIDGVVAYFKGEIERNPAAGVSIQKFNDTMQETSAILNEDVKFI